MSFLAGYLAFLVIFGVFDAIWLSTMAGLMYRPLLGDLILEKPRWVPALLFYFGFPLGVIHFGLMPALRAEMPSLAFVNGALLGLFAYATYDLTNYATMRVWSLQVTVADMVYGTLAVGLATFGAYYVVRQVTNWGWI